MNHSIRGENKVIDVEKYSIFIWYLQLLKLLETILSYNLYSPPLTYSFPSLSTAMAASLFPSCMKGPNCHSRPSEPSLLQALVS